jgi:hypothetical protein
MVCRFKKSNYLETKSVDVRSYQRNETKNIFDVRGGKLELRFVTKSFMSLDCVQQFSLLDIPYHHDSLFAPKSIY